MTVRFSESADATGTIRKRLRIVLTAVVIAWLSGYAAATSANASDQTVVFPTGDAAVDVPSVQAALNAGGVVLLKATNVVGQPTAFNFGPSSTAGQWVTIDFDVVLTGETTAAGMTTIRGGNGPITIENGATATVAGLAFDHPFWDAINSFNSGNIRIVGNRIEHVVGAANPQGITSGDGIDVGFAEDVAITDNVIDDVDAAFGEGIAEFGASGRVEIARNSITGVNLAGVEVTQYVFRQGQGTSIYENYVRPGPPRYARGAAGTGIELNGDGHFDVERNEVICENDNAACIFVFGASGFFGFGAMDAPKIAHNDIRLQTTPFGAVGVALVGEVSRAFVAQNHVGGSGFAGFATFACTCSPASLIDAPSFIGNEIATMRSGEADVYLDTVTRNAVLVGLSGSVVDLGTNDLLTGFNVTDNSGTSIGARVSQAITERLVETQTTSFGVLGGPAR